MTRYHFVVVLFSILPAAVFLPGCDLVSPEEKQGIIRALTESEKHVVDADNRFGLNLFRSVSEAEGEKNVFISPLSVSMALGMTLNGADGETYSAMKETLELHGLESEEINQSYRSLIDLLRGLDPKVVFEIANSIWTREGFEVEPAFVDTNRTYFDAEVRSLDFSGPDAVDTINRWVDEKTHGKIEEIVEGIDPDVMMYLINALYFSGTWTYEFDEEATEALPFAHADGTQSDVTMMMQETDLPYFATDTFQAVDVPYGDSLYSMTVMLPREGVDLDALIGNLDQETWTDWMSRFSVHGVSLQLPRFTLEYKIQLKQALSALGMEIAFEPQQADFTRINSRSGLYLSSVLHKTFVEVDEEGTEAAAVTSVEVRLTSVGGGTIPVHVNRPFLFSIRERHSGTILFIGKIVNL